MKRNILIMAIALFSVAAFGQENKVSLNGGFVFGTRVDGIDVSTTGWRIGGLYEYNPMAGRLSHGLSVGYVQTTGSDDAAEYTLQTYPIYYAPKYMFGNDSFKGFIKGALGMHFSNYTRTGSILETEYDEYGFYGGAGLGLMKNLGESFFISAEYEFAWMSESYYENGIINSVMAGLGIRF